MLTQGQRVLGYTLQDEIGNGGMATIYRAVNPLGFQRAIKVLKPQYSRNAQVRQRFEQEAKIMVELGKHSDHICQVENLDISEGYIALVMEYLQGQNLTDYLYQLGAVTPRQLVEWLEPVLKAIGYAHEKGVVHRDIKPANLFLTTDGQLKVLDFGIARVLTSGKDLTKTRQILGTARFMSPEQIQTPKLVDSRSDIYALGVTIWTLLAGKSPYDDDEDTGSEFAILTKIVYEPLPLLTDSASVFNDLIQQATAKSADERYPNCQLLAEALVNVLKVPVREVMHEPAPRDPEKSMPDVGPHEFMGTTAKSMPLLSLQPLADELPTQITNEFPIKNVESERTSARIIKIDSPEINKINSPAILTSDKEKTRIKNDHTSKGSIEVSPSQPNKTEGILARFNLGAKDKLTFYNKILGGAIILFTSLLLVSGFSTGHDRIISVLLLAGGALLALIGFKAINCYFIVAKYAPRKATFYLLSAVWIASIYEIYQPFISMSESLKGAQYLDGVFEAVILSTLTIILSGITYAIISGLRVKLKMYNYFTLFYAIAPILYSSFEFLNIGIGTVLYSLSGVGGNSTVLKENVRILSVMFYIRDIAFLGSFFVVFMMNTKLSNYLKTNSIQ